MTSTLVVPEHFSFRDRDIVDFQPVLNWFSWNISDDNILLDLQDCKSANYQTLALLVLYIWHLKTNSCDVRLIHNSSPMSGSTMFKNMGASGWSQVLFEDRQNFRGHEYKPLIAIRDSQDFKKALTRVEEYTRGFDVEYEKTLRYIISELLYNTLEHGVCVRKQRFRDVRVPSLIQFTWYKKRNELAVIIADLGIGVRRHLEQAYPAFESDEAALREAIRPRVSGTFGSSSEYRSQNNAGVGLFISTNIAQRLHADMYVCSGNGVLHVSPRDITTHTIAANWPGTFAYVVLRLKQSRLRLTLHEIMSELRKASRAEQQLGEYTEQESRYVVGIENYFGRYAENKIEAINYRDKYLLPAAQEGRPILLDFRNVQSSTHSFLNALLADPIRALGVTAYKKIKIVNAPAEIRETIDYILDEHTN